MNWMNLNNHIYILNNHIYENAYILFSYCFFTHDLVKSLKKKKKKEEAKN